jgi:penicillin amidase
MPNRSRRRWPRRLLRVLLVVLASLLGLALVAALGAVLLLRGSLPRLDGERELVGLDAVVTVTRDSLGVPDIQAASRADAARALGYLHAQDRFFQMDLQRRGAAGELAALLGPALIETDRERRVHRFRRRAAAVLAALPTSERALLEAYADGVNAGLADLRVRPFEYLVLRQEPAPWRPADTVLTLHAMCLDLSYLAATNELMWATVRDQLGESWTDFLLPRDNPWNAPLQTGPVPGIAIPDSSACDLRRWIFDGKSDAVYRDEQLGLARHDTAGSNSWAVAGALTAHGGAILANDMHLGLGLPNIWYRARMSWPEGEGRRAVVGVTLPGAHALIVGSNGELAWGFTNSMGDWADLVILETDSIDAARYRTPEGWRRLERVPEVIAVAGTEPDTLVVEETVWGPIWATDTRGRRLALRWTAHDTEAVNFQLRHLESAHDVDAAVAVAGRCGIPPQNLVCADRDGRIAWALAGRIPRRIGWDGRLPVSWADGEHRWDGYLDPAEQPRLLDPQEGRLWTANNRVAAGGDLALIGDGGYALGWRARQIRDGLRALDRPVEAELLAVALDDRALMLERWRRLALATMDRAPAPVDSTRLVFAQVLRDEWTGRAEPASVAYRLVRAFALHCIDAVYGPVARRCEVADRDFRASWLPYRHAVTWAVLEARPPHLLPPWYADWDAVVLAAVDAAMAGAAADGRALEQFTWGQRNVALVEHPFVKVEPRLARWLAAPRVGMPGDSFMPRVQHRTSGASERLVVSPGREERGILHMPGGQSGHPWSPCFLAGHEAWVEGQATPLLPGGTRHRLMLVPADGIR